jgi:hypothetical protein
VAVVAACTRAAPAPLPGTGGTGAGTPTTSPAGGPGGASGRTGTLTVTGWQLPAHGTPPAFGPAAAVYGRFWQAYRDAAARADAASPRLLSMVAPAARAAVRRVLLGSAARGLRETGQITLSPGYLLRPGPPRYAVISDCFDRTRVRLLDASGRVSAPDPPAYRITVIVGVTPGHLVVTGVTGGLRC